MPKNLKCRRCGGTGLEINRHSLRLERMARGFSQTTLAKRMGIKLAYLNDLEHGRRDWTAKKLAWFRKAMR